MFLNSSLRLVLVVLLTVFLSVTQKASADSKISCEIILDFDAGLNGILKSCDVSSSVKINSTKARFSDVSNQAVSRLHLSNNKNIFFLPENIDEKFPNLLQYEAKYCEILIITKTNLKNLGKLRKLNLWGNKIEKIPNDVFQDLVGLEVLSLGKLKNLRKKS